MEACKSFYNGVPTEPDVKKIRETYPETNLKEGDIIEYEKIEQIIGCKKLSSRYKTVTCRWRKILEEEFSIVVGTVRNLGYKILSDSEKVGHSGGYLRKAGKAVKRSYSVTTTIDTRNLNQHEKRLLEHNQSISAQILAINQIKRIGKKGINKQ